MNQKGNQGKQIPVCHCRIPTTIQQKVSSQSQQQQGNSRSFVTKNLQDIFSAIPKTY
ncbi:MAG: hypothetical protein ACJAYJ_000476 [Saprospiraceae bacterium]